MPSISSPPSPPSAQELDLRCWNLLRAYATSDILVGEIELRISDVFRDSTLTYDEVLWRARLGRIMGTEPDDIDAIQANIEWIDGAISNLSMDLYTNNDTAPVLTAQPPLIPEPSVDTLISEPSLDTHAFSTINVEMQFTTPAGSITTAVSSKSTTVRTSLKEYAARKRLVRSKAGMDNASSPVENNDEESGKLRYLYLCLYR